MPINRFFSDSLTKTSIDVTLEDQEFHHLARVTRTQAGEAVELINGFGLLAKAIVKEISKNKAELQIEQVEAFSPPSSKCTLVQAILKPSKLEIILEKGTELGVDQFWFFPADRGEKQDFSTTQMTRLNTILLSATKQCGRLYLPKICLKNALSKWDSFPKESFYGKLGYETVPFAKILSKQPSLQDAHFFIGPESGFSEKELSFLETHGVQGVSLNKNILRTETAAIAALSIYFGSTSHLIVERSTL